MLRVLAERIVRSVSMLKFEFEGQSLRLTTSLGIAIYPDHAGTVEELVAHVLESGALMAGELSRPDGSFRRKSYEALLREHSRGIRKTGTRRQLLAALRSSHRDGERRIRRAGEIHMLQEITRFDGKKGTRLAWMNHGIAHEEYHRGQIALYARLIGRTPALTKLIQEG